MSNRCGLEALYRSAKGVQMAANVSLLLQILNLSNGKVVAAARLPPKAAELQELQKQHEGRLTLVSLDLSEPSTAQVSLFSHYRSQCTSSHYIQDAQLPASKLACGKEFPVPQARWASHRDSTGAKSLC